MPAWASPSSKKGWNTPLAGANTFGTCPNNSLKNRIPSSSLPPRMGSCPGSSKQSSALNPATAGASPGRTTAVYPRSRASRSPRCPSCNIRSQGNTARWEWPWYWGTKSPSSSPLLHREAIVAGRPYFSQVTGRGSNAISRNPEALICSKSGLATVTKGVITPRWPSPSRTDASTSNNPSRSGVSSRVS